MIFSEFTNLYYKEYCTWFEDKTLDKWLGPKPDKEWLNYILADEVGKQYSIVQKGKMVAVLGTAHPTKNFPFLVITDIAIHPKLRGKGIGQKVINNLLRLYPNVCFKAFVEEKNLKAIAFFEHLGWEKAEEIDEDGMWAFTYGAFSEFK